jgi:lysine/ornithine N-monooxygenase
MPVFLGHQIRAVEARSGRIALQITDQNERPKELVADHVIASTGYRFDLQNLPFFGQGLTSRIRKEKQLPQLSSNFESSVPGLYFTGIASANSFGSAMRFLVGSAYTARRIASHVAKSQRPPAGTFAPLQKCLEK